MIKSFLNILIEWILVLMTAILLPFILIFGWVKTLFSEAKTNREKTQVSKEVAVTFFIFLITLVLYLIFSF